VPATSGGAGRHPAFLEREKFSQKIEKIIKLGEGSVGGIVPPHPEVQGFIWQQKNQKDNQPLRRQHWQNCAATSSSAGMHPLFWERKKVGQTFETINLLLVDFLPAARQLNATANHCRTLCHCHQVIFCVLIVPHFFAPGSMWVAAYHCHQVDFICCFCSKATDATATMAIARCQFFSWNTTATVAG